YRHSASGGQTDRQGQPGSGSPAPTAEPSAGQPTKCRTQKPVRHFSPDPLQHQHPVQFHHSQDPRLPDRRKHPPFVLPGSSLTHRPTTVVVISSMAHGVSPPWSWSAWWAASSGPPPIIVSIGSPPEVTTGPGAPRPGLGKAMLSQVV